MSKNKFSLGLLIMIYFSLLFGCSSLKTNNSDFQIGYIKAKAKQLKKPHFTIDIKSNSVSYNGIANMPILGETNFKLSKTALKELKTAFEEADFHQFKKTYIGNYRDLSITTITYKDYQVRYQEKEAPEKLKTLAILLESCLPNNYKYQ